MDIFDLNNNILNDIIKYSVINICIYFVIIKIINFQGSSIRKVMVIFLLSIVLSIGYVYINLNINSFYAFLVSYFLYGTVIKFLLNKRYMYALLITLISLAITYMIFLLSIFVISVFLVVILKIKSASFTAFLVIDCFTMILVLLFLHMKKLKHGVDFLQNENRIEIIGIIGIPICCIFLFFYFFYDKIIAFQNVALFAYTLLAIGIISISMFIWIKKALTIYYKDIMTDKTIKALKEQLKQADFIQENILESVSKETHRFNHKLDVLENIIAKIWSSPEIPQTFKEELSGELGFFVEEVNNLSTEYMEIIKNIERKKISSLPKTNIPALDSVFEYMQLESVKNNIEFALNLSEGIHFMTENMITKDKLATLLSDHLKDAIIAINNSNNSYRSILVLLGQIGENYGLCIYDTGIEFEVNTLVNIGLKPVTTHSNKGGTGYGFMTTFDTLRETKASIVIDEKRPSSTDYTKAVSIIFDNKNEYRINSYRADKIQGADTENRIIIKKSQKKD